VLAVLSRLGLDVRRPPPPGSALGGAVALLGPALARRLLAWREIPAEAWPVLDALARELRGAMIGGLCRDGEASPHGTALLDALCRRYGAAELLAVLDPLQVGPVMAAAAIRASLASGAEPATLIKVIERMDPPSALSALAAGPSLCAHAVGVVTELLLRESSTVRHLPAFLRAGVEAATCGGSALLTALARGAELSDLDECMVTLVEAGQGRATVLSVWKRRALRSGARRSALLALQNDARLFSDAMHFADSGEEPPDLRQLLEELRWQEPA
jgi:hypothetical protein